MDTKIFNLTVARNLRFLREERGLTDRELANKINKIVSKSLIGKIENCEHKFKVAEENIRHLANGLCVDIDVLLESNEKINSALATLESSLTSTIDDKFEIMKKLDALVFHTSARSPREFALSLVLRGRLEYHLTRYQSAISYFLMAMNIAQKAGDQETLIKANHDLLSSRLMLGQYEAVSELVLKQLDDMDIIEKSGAFSFWSNIGEIDKWKAKFLYLVARVHSRHRNWTDAEKCLQEAINILPKTSENKILEGSFYQGLGEVYRNTKEKYNDCISVSKVAINIAKEINDPLREIYALITIGEMYYKTDDTELSCATFEQAANRVEMFSQHNHGEKLRIDLWISLCKSNLQRTLGCLDQLKQTQISPRQLGEFYREAALLAKKLGSIETAFELYETASQILLE
ncbi:helix-turn-helix domain-containing protein [Tumebacillus permanentifrigoris]|uniref:Anaphase-promoting complex subunit 5 n=1 Tax=Tumebacillus permanentifrigoris TaxID=378543 RepID=A0A316D2W2_9BACL|nr:helix-turn-helix transcriptional regulator [Tumebacillus permanentifrigoris]PWK05283.1 anaphase-promoting complex subunit 5 [Tumebacillus permanentifrigoris]